MAKRSFPLKLKHPEAEAEIHHQIAEMNVWDKVSINFIIKSTQTVYGEK